MGSNGINNSPYVSASVVSRSYLFTSQQNVRRMCRDGLFKTARKPTGGKNSPWQISRVELIQYMNKIQSQPQTEL
jgi:hypothetical protein